MTRKEMRELKERINGDLDALISEAERKKVKVTNKEIETIRERLLLEMERDTNVSKEKIELKIDKMMRIIQDTIEQEAEANSLKENFRKRLRIRTAAGLMAGAAIGAVGLNILQEKPKGYNQSHMADEIKRMEENTGEEFIIHDEAWEEIEQDYNDYRTLMAQNEEDLSDAQKAEIKVLQERLVREGKDLAKITLEVIKKVESREVGKKVEEVWAVEGKLWSDRYVYNDGTQGDNRFSWPKLKGKEANELMDSYMKLQSSNERINLKEATREEIADLAERNANLFERVSDDLEEIIQEEQEENKIQETESEKEEGFEIE